MENKTKTKRPPRKRRSLSVAERKKQLHLRIGLSLAGIFLVFFLFLAPFGPHLLFGKGRAVNLSDSVLQYQALVDQYCEEYSIPAFSQVVLAIMQQESAGSVADVMQASRKPFQHLVCQHTEQHPGSRLFHPSGRGDLRLLPERGRLHFPQAKVQAKTRLTNLQLWKFLRFLGSHQLRRLFPGQCAGICRKYEGKAWLEPVRRPGICLPCAPILPLVTVQYLHSYYRP